MSGEVNAIRAVSVPSTVASLTGDLVRLGLGDGQVTIVHSSLSALGFVAGGAQAVVEALIAGAGPTGTLVMPTQSGHLGDPAAWENPPVPPEWIETIRSEMPAYDPHLTPTRSMGAIVDCFRSVPAAVRSDHPTESFAAHGPLAGEIVSGHRFDDGFGESSPLATLYDLDAQILLLGVGHANNTSLHLAEHRADWTPKVRIQIGAPISIDGERRWMTADVLEPNEDDFDQIGAAIEAADIESVGSVGAAIARLMKVRDAVDVGAGWMSEHRPESLPQE